MSNSTVKSVQAKLKLFEQKMRSLEHQFKEDLELAQKLQKLLIPQPLKSIPGLKCHVKYKSSVHAFNEYYDLFTSHKNSKLWLISSMTSSYGMNALLMQGILYFQNRVKTESLTNQENPARELFQHLLESLKHSKKEAQYRVSVFCLDLKSLKAELCSIGRLPPLYNNKTQNQKAHFLFEQSFKKNAALLNSHDPLKPIVENNLLHQQWTVKPGEQLYFISNGWNQTHNLSEITSILNQDLELQSLQEKKENGALNNLNQYMINIQKTIKKSRKPSDIAVIALEINKNKLYLAS